MPNPNPPTAQLKPYQWKKGQSGNPSGRPEDAGRRKLTEYLIECLLKDFAERGEEAVKKCRQKDVVAYLKIVAGLIPKDLNVEHTVKYEDIIDKLWQDANNFTAKRNLEGPDGTH